MIKEIKYNGFSANPSDYECPDGDLAASIGAILEDGALKPVLPPSEIMQLPEGTTVLYIHKTASYKHYIVKNDDDDVYWIAQNGGNFTESNKIGRYSDVKSINSVGNTLLVFTETAINYHLWKTDRYISLGDHVPNVEISFGLKGRTLVYVEDEEKRDYVFKITFDKIAKDNLYAPWSEENQSKITAQIMAKVNKFLADETIHKGRFAFPFFVRYALRLYDGSLIGHSAPILMNPSTTTTPVVFCGEIGGDGGYTEADCGIMLVTASLDYQLHPMESDTYGENMKNWTDIIKSVDVFISAPIYTYDQSGKCTSFGDGDNLDTKFIGALEFDGCSKHFKNNHVLLPMKIGNMDLDEETYPPSASPLATSYAEWKYSTLFSMCYSGIREFPSTTVHLPEFSDQKKAERIKDVSTFYFLHSISIEELYKADENGYAYRKDIYISDDYLKSLVSHEVMTDDYLSHDRLMADYSHGYNSRLNLSGVKRKLFRGFSPTSMFSYTNTDIPGIVVGTPGHPLEYYPMEITFPRSGSSKIGIEVYIKENAETYKVRCEGDDFWPMAHYLSVTRYPVKEDGTTDTADGYLVKNSWGCYVFYPNASAFKMRITDNLGSYDISLKPHDFLNGAYALLDYEQERTPQTSYTEVSSSDNIIDIPNKLYTSEVNNPFVFPLLGINTIGTGRIIGISSAVKALSEGQFGQFPLYAFTSEGVWAMEVSQTGTYSAKQPVTRDVCINPDSITQIDSAVLFATSRGIMYISGSTTQCITESVNAPKLYGLTDLPKNEVLVSLFNDRAHDYEQFTSADTIFLSFLDFLADCRMVYDYTHQRIIAYNPSVRYAYIYSFKSQAWGMMLSDIKSNVNSYPEALVMSSKKITIIGDDGQETTSTASVLQDFTATAADDATALIITRPFKMDDPDMFKTIDTIIQRGVFKSENVLQVLYASNDLYHWLTVWSSKDKYMRGFRGTPHKAFRLALVVNLAKGESLYGCTVQFRPRMLDQPR